MKKGLKIGCLEIEDEKSINMSVKMSGLLSEAENESKTIYGFWPLKFVTRGGWGRYGTVSQGEGEG